MLRLQAENDALHAAVSQDLLTLDVEREPALT